MFTATELIAQLNAKPFVPFKLHLSDGGAIPVPTRELVSVGRRMAIIGLLDPGQNDTIFDRWTMVSYIHVTRVELLSPSAMPFSPPQPSGNDVPSQVA